MYVKKIIRCLKCNDEVELVYDTRVNSIDRMKQYASKCKCGDLDVSCQGKYGYSYNPNGNCGELVKEESHDYEEDYFKPSNQFIELFEKVKVLTEELSFSQCGDICTNEDYIDFEYFEPVEKGDCDFIKINFKLNLHDDFGFDSEKYNQIYFERLSKFYDFLLKAKDDESLLKNYKELWDKPDKFGLEGNKEQIEKYDYNFYF